MSDFIQSIECLNCGTAYDPKCSECGSIDHLAQTNAGVKLTTALKEIDELTIKWEKEYKKYIDYYSVNTKYAELILIDLKKLRKGLE